MTHSNQHEGMPFHSYWPSWYLDWNTCWKLCCLEYGIQSEGVILAVKRISRKMLRWSIWMDLLISYLWDKRWESCAWALFPTRNCYIWDSYREVPDPEQLVSGKAGSANNYAWCHYSVESEVVYLGLESIWKLSEQFLTFWSFEGNNESGFTYFLVEWLMVEYSWKTKLSSLYLQPSVSSLL